jgi:hypothetical protein
MSVKDCIKLLTSLDPEDAASVKAQQKDLVASGVPGNEAWEQAVELAMEGVLGERNDLAAEIRGKGGYLQDLTIENLLNPKSYPQGVESPKGPYSGDLDMSQKARFARARGQGFDTGTTWYHGTGTDFEAFDHSKGGKNYNLSNDAGLMWFTKDAGLAWGKGDDAAVVADESREWIRAPNGDEQGTYPGSNVIPVFIRAKNTLVEDYMNATFPNAEWLIKNGYDSYRIIGGESGNGDDIATVSDEQIRSVNAIFDPNSSESADMVASPKGPYNSKETGVYSGYDIPQESRETKNSVREDESGQRDLFTEPGISGEEARTQSADTFSILYEQVETGTIQSGVTHVKNHGDLAHLLAGIRKHAQETFIVTVTDDDGKILNVIRHSIGTRDGASVYPLDVIGAIAATEGGTQYWMTHNHPSGSLKPSNADEKITDVIRKAATGLNVKYMGHVVIADTSFSEVFGEVPNQSIPAYSRRKKVPITERRLKRKEKNNSDAITSPYHTTTYVDSLASESGLVLLNNRNVPVGVVALTPAEMSKLRDGKQVRRILTAIDKTNAIAGIGFNKTLDTSSLENLGNYLDHIKGFRVLDMVYRGRDGDLTAFTNSSLTLGDEGMGFAMRRRKPSLRDEIPGLKEIWHHLTKPEQDKLNRSTAKTLVDMFQKMPDAKEMAAVAYSGRAKKGWYANSARAIVDIFGADDAPRFAALLAALSPQVSVEQNAINAIKIWNAWTTYGSTNPVSIRNPDPTVGPRKDRPTDKNTILEIMTGNVPGDKGLDSVMGAWINNTIRALTAADPETLVISGPKVNSFMLNLRGEVNEVTNDTWMARYAAMDPSIFEGSITQTGRDPGKGPRYMAMVAMVRKAAKIITQRTGETWTPAEVQETIWSWAKTVFEKANAAGEKRSVVQLLQEGDLHHEEIADAVDFEALFVQKAFREILGAPYAEQLDTVQRIAESRRGSGELDVKTGSATAAEGAGITENSFARHLRRAGKRLEQVRKTKNEVDPKANALIQAQSGDTVSRIDQARHRRKVSGWLEKPLKRLSNRIPVIVKNNESEVDFHVPPKSAGLKRRGKVYLFKDNIRNEQEAIEAITHEAIGHLGIENVFGNQKFEELMGDVMNIMVEIMMDPSGTQHAKVREIQAELHKYYRDDNGKYNLDPKQEAREIIAHIAHSKPRLGRLREIYNKIVAWLKDFAVSMGLADPDLAKIENMLISATDYVINYQGDAFIDNEAPAAMRRQDERPEETEEAKEMLRKLGLGGSEGKNLIRRIFDIKSADVKKALQAGVGRVYEGLFDGLIEGLRAEKAAGVGMGKEMTYMTPDGVEKRTVDHENSFYVAARLATGVSDMMTHLLNWGSLKWDGGIVSGVENSRGLLNVLGDLGKENLNDWLVWMAGNRADQLYSDNPDLNREQNLTREEIDLAMTRNQGKEELFTRIKEEYNTMNAAQLDFAQEAGLIDPVKRADWESEWYVPFYRQTDEDRSLGPNTTRGLSHQSAGIRRLMGSGVPTADLFENLLANWIKLTDASVKNHALRTMVSNFSDEGRAEGEELGYISNETMKFQKAMVPKGEIHKFIKDNREFALNLSAWLDLPPQTTADGIWDAVSDMDAAGLEKVWQIVAPTAPDVVRIQNNGKNEYYKVHVPGLLRAVGHISEQGNQSGLMKAARKFKSLLTVGVTASPDFMIRNFIRDAAHSWAINKDGMTFLVDSMKGLKGAATADPIHRAMMAAGASFQGGYVHGTDPEATAQIMRRELEKAGLAKSKIDAYLGTITSPSKMVKLVGRGWQHYRDAGDRVENASRVATARAGMEAGKPMAQWLFESKDLMDYSRRGNFAALVFMTDVMPFLNARIQGLDKLGRAGKADPKLVLQKMTMIAAFSIFLATLNDDDDDYQQLPDWEKDAYWHVFPDLGSGKEHVRIPKPFEIGFIAATMPERMYRAWVTDTQPNEKVLWALHHGFKETLNINIYPQIILPIAELKANRHFYFDQPIEGLSDQNKTSDRRFNEYTSETARVAGDTAMAKWMGVSPKQLQHLWNGYTGTMGAYLLSAVDMMVTNPLGDFSTPEEIQPEDYPALKSLYKGQRKRTTQWQIDFYDRMGEVKELHGTLQDHIKRGELDKARAFRDENKDKLKFRRKLQGVQRKFSKLRDRRERILRDDSLTRAEKFKQSQKIQVQINALAKKIEAFSRPGWAG